MEEIKIQPMVKIMKSRTRLLYILLFAFCSLLLAGSESLAAADDTAPPFVPAADDSVSTVLPQETAPPSLCRLGVNAPGGISAYDVSSLRIGWYLDYGARENPAEPNGIRYAQMVRLQQTGPNSYSYSPGKSTIQQIAQKNPGAFWFIGNEPDRPDKELTGQDDILPQLYARAYHELYTLLKATDPSAQVLAGSIVQPTEVRLKYLDIVLQTYRSQHHRLMPVDGWSIHNFILNEADCDHPDFGPAECWGADIPPGVNESEGLRVDVQDNDNFDLFVEQIVRFRHWMTANGYRGDPLYLSEYGVLMPQGIFEPDFDTVRVNEYMNNTFNYLLNTSDPVHGNPADGHRLVQRLSWFSTTFTNYNGYLFNPDSAQMTAIGQNYRNYAAGLASTVDVYPLSITSSPPALVSDRPVTATVTAQIANSGNTQTPQVSTVRFYDGNPQSGGQLIGAPQQVEIRGCGETAAASVEWQNIPVGANTVYVSVEHAGVDTAGRPAAESEIEKSNNSIERMLVVSEDAVYLPSVNR